MKSFIVKKPWGDFEEFTCNEQTTVKILTIIPGGSLSLQYHAKREEFWKVLAGNPEVTIGERVTTAAPGDELSVPIGEQHRIASKNDTVKILEISYGEFDENDITRLKDDYGRESK